MHFLHDIVVKTKHTINAAIEFTPMVYNSHLAKTSNEANERLVRRVCMYLFTSAESLLFVIELVVNIGQLISRI